ncbi:MAG: amino acid lyase, partial [Bacteroidales bacterium]|nr:amino acid lyase [Bacteroidales bacterium]
GTDHYCESAKEKIRAACEAPEAEVFFLVGGTQTNSTIIAAMLADYEGVVSAETGHIGVHEAGAVEYTGHKVLTIPSHHGKIDPKELRDYLEAATNDPNYEHMVFPGMVYISFPTEYGTIYSKAELEEIHGIAAHYGLPLMIDGARLGYGLTSPACDLTLPELASLCEVFYIGGTKVGCLCGEAVVFPRGNAPKHFYTITKQHGAMLAKGRVLGIQFDTLFTDNLYFEISRHAIDMAMQLKELLRQKGCTFFIDSPTNQQFIVLENKKIEELGKHVAYDPWDRVDPDHTAIRLATSWATQPEQLEELKRWI